ncbi:MAG: DUF2752 domain-containing protein [Bacteroidales bacterium]
MIHSIPKNNLVSEWKDQLEKDSYLKINLVLAGVIVIIMAYSGFFSPEKNNYPVVCLHEKITGEPCASCGLSHSLSLLLRGRFDEAYTWNRYGFLVFLFFSGQLFIRILNSVRYIKCPEYRPKIILFDIIVSALMFAVAFYPYFRQIILEFRMSL